MRNGAAMPHIRPLYEQLSKLNEALCELDTLVLQERKDITGLNITGLDAHRLAMENVFVRVRTLSEQAGTLIRAACDLSNITVDKGLTALIAVIPKPDRELFVKLQKTIHSVSAGIENSLAVNRALLEDSLAFTNQSLLMFTSMLKSISTNTYGQAGRFIETRDQPRIICKEI